MTDRLTEIEERANAATAERWKPDGRRVRAVEGIVAECLTPQHGGTFACMDNAAFIAAAREDIPWLCQTLRAVEKLATELEDTAAWEAAENHNTQYANGVDHAATELRRTLKGEA